MTSQKLAICGKKRDRNIKQAVILLPRMPHNIDIAAIADEMLRLEDQRDDSNPNVAAGAVIAKLLDIPHSGRFDDVLREQIDRTLQLAIGHYSLFRPGGLTDSDLAAIGLLQGITLACAVENLKTVMPETVIVRRLSKAEDDPRR